MALWRGKQAALALRRGHSRLHGLERARSGRLASVAVAGTVTVLIALLASPAAAQAGAMLRLPGCNANSLPANDDGSTATSVPLSFPITIQSTTYNSVWVNNNGNVTFDGPLITYTPSPIAGTGSLIIAPFWADVDTRGAGSAVVTYGTTTYQGRAAFCVEWDGVGYFSAHTDKLNQFELLLVSRPDRVTGDVDIIFNYDQVQWETGDASGGSGGFGGTAARVGWSLGPGSNVELPGSGVPGSFIDGGPDALVSNMVGSNVPGRYVFPVHGGQAPAQRYVALGDSYSSGEGAPPFINGTDTPSDGCHRSYVAYPELLVSHHAGGSIPSTVEFWACSGSLTGDFYSPNHAFGEPPQLGDLVPGDATLVTLSIGGNDIGFANIGATCLKVSATIFDQLNNHYQANCRNGLDASTMASIANLPLPTLFADIRHAAPLAQIYVMGYPRLLPASPTSDCQAQAYREDGRKATGSPFDQNATDGIIGIETRIVKDDVIWMDKVISRLNGRIAAAAAAAGFHYVDDENAFAGHDVCNNNTDPSNEPWGHGLVLLSNTNDPKKNPSPFSFHPNLLGQSAMADALYQSIAGGMTGTVQQNQTSIFSVLVSAGQGFLNIITHWPGSDTDTTLVSPSGQVYSASSPGISHFKTSTTENYVIPNPQPGTWTVNVYGTAIDLGGEPVRVDSSTAPAQDFAPVAVAVAPAAAIAHRSNSFDGSGSTGTSAPIAAYLWSFGDGSTGSGATVMHTYARAGVYTATLTVTDTAGHTDTAPRTITVFGRDRRPTPSLLVFQDPRNDAHIAYDASGSTDADGQSVRLALTLGDGARSTSASGLHVFPFAGTYPLRLTVTDTGGLHARATRSVTVRHARALIRHLRLSRRRFTAAGGTTVKYTAAHSGKATLTLLQRLVGVVNGRRCVTGHRHRGRRARRCTVYRAVGHFGARDRRGLNAISFTGRVHGHLLRPGQYELQVIGQAFQFTSLPDVVRFTFLG